MAISNCKLIELPKVSDPRGNLTFVEGGCHIPFEIKRVFYLYDVPTERIAVRTHIKNCTSFWFVSPEVSM